MTENGYDMSIALDESWFDPGWFRMSQHMTRDRKLSTEAVGAAARMVDNDRGFRFNATFLQKKLGWGRDKVRRVLNELEHGGYLATVQLRGDDGRYTGEIIYRLYPKPQGQGQVTENQSPGDTDRTTENQSSGEHQTTENQSSGDDQGKRDVSAGQTERLKTRPWKSATNKDLKETKIQSKPRSIPEAEGSDAPAVPDGWMDGSQRPKTDETAPKELLRAILEAHQVPRPQWPVNGLYGSAITETRRLLDAGVAPAAVIDYVASRGSLTGPGIGAASPVLVARLKAMPVVASKPVSAPKAKRCVGGCVDGRVVCSIDCPDEVGPERLGDPDPVTGIRPKIKSTKPCRGNHEPRGELCRMCTPQQASHRG